MFKVTQCEMLHETKSGATRFNFFFFLLTSYRRKKEEGKKKWVAKHKNQHRLMIGRSQSCAAYEVMTMVIIFSFLHCSLATIYRNGFARIRRRSSSERLLVLLNLSVIGRANEGEEEVKSTQCNISKFASLVRVMANDKRATFQSSQKGNIYRLSSVRWET